MMKCPKCGNINESEMTFCGHCGAKLESIPPQFVRSEKPSRNLGLPIGIGAFAAVMIIASFVGFLMIRGNNTAPPISTTPTKIPEKLTEKQPEKPNVDVPDMHGISESQARDVLKAKKLVAEVHTSHSAIIPAGQVISQDPK